MATTSSVIQDYLLEVQELGVECLAATDNSLEQEVLRDFGVMRLVKKWKPILGFDSKTILGHLDRFIAKETFGTGSEIESYLYKQVRDWDCDGGMWLVPGLFLRSAMYFWYGMGKSGKTSTALHLIYAVLVSGEFLGYPVIKGPVLWVNLEQGKGLVRMQMEQVGFNDLENEQSRLLLSSDLLRLWLTFDLKRDLPKLEECLKTYKPVLVVIDSFRKSLVGSGYTEMDDQAMVLSYQLQNIFLKYPSTCVMIHHATKGGVMAGHNGLYGANDGLIYFEKTIDPETNRFCVRMKTNPRLGEPQSFILDRRTGRGGRKTLIKLREENTRPDIQIVMDELLVLMSKNIIRKLTFQEIQNALGNYSIERLEEALLRLQELQIVDVELIDTPKQTSREFVYFLPKKSAWDDNGGLLASFIKDIHRKAALLLACKTASDLYYLIGQWDSQEVNQIYNQLSSTEQSYLKRVRDNYSFEVPSTVLYMGEELTITKREKGKYWIEECSKWEFEFNLSPVQTEEADSSF